MASGILFYSNIYHEFKVSLTLNDLRHLQLILERASIGLLQLLLLLMCCTQGTPLNSEIRWIGEFWSITKVRLTMDM